jgi:transposase
LLSKLKIIKGVLMTGCFNGITGFLIKLFFPRKKTHLGRPYANFRGVINSILYVLIEGGRWASIPKGKQWAPKSTAYEWLKIMSADGTLNKILSTIVKKADNQGLIEWEDVEFDGSFSPGKGEGKGSTIHLMADGNGMPLNATVTAANGDERLEIMPLLNGSHILKDGSIKNAHCDKGYDSVHVREGFICIGIKPIIPYRNFKNRAKKTVNVVSSHVRWKIKRCFAWLKSKFRRIAVRWERKVIIWKGFIDLAIIVMWIYKLVFG